MLCEIYMYCNFHCASEVHLGLQSSVQLCSVCSYLDKYLSYYIIYILLASTPLTAAT